MGAFFEIKDKNDVYAQVVNTLDYPLHLHPQMEIFHVYEGEVIVTVRNMTRLMNAGDFVVIFPNEIHSYTTLLPRISAILAHWDLSFCGGYMDLLMTNHPVNPFLRFEQLHPNIALAINEMIREQNGQNKLPVYAPLIQLLLVRLLPDLELVRNKNNDYPELTYQIANYITENYRDPITVGMLAQKLGISKHHLSHLFSEKMGQSFPSYLTSIRLSAACRLLTETDKSVTEIAEMTGFESQCNFFRTFKKRFEITPLKYRQANRKEKEVSE